MAMMTKETFLEIVKDKGATFTEGLLAVVKAMYENMVSLEARVTRIDRDLTELTDDEETVTSGRVDGWVADALKNSPPEPPDYDEEQMLGDRSPYGWHLLHPTCKSWKTVRKYRQQLVDACKAHGIFKTSDQTLISNSIESAIHRNAEFKSYRGWVWKLTGSPDAVPSVAGLDPWSCVEGLRELAGPADDPAFRCRFVEIHSAKG